MNKKAGKKNLNSHAKAKKLPPKPTAKPTKVEVKVVKSGGAKLSIDEIAEVAEKRNFTVDQFTRLVIHNGHTEKQFDDWLDSRLDATAVKELPPVKDTETRDWFEKIDPDDKPTSGYSGKMRFVDSREPK